MINSKYPKAEKFLRKHPEMTIDQALEFLRREIQDETWTKRTEGTATRVESPQVRAAERRD